MTSKLKTDVLETVSGSGTIALTNQLSGMTHESMPVGSVLQVVTNNHTQASAVTTSSISFVAAGAPFELIITPKYSNSLICAEITIGMQYTGVANTSVITTPTKDGVIMNTDSYAYYNRDASTFYGGVHMSESLISGSTSPITYGFSFRSSISGNNVYGYHENSAYSIKLTEIKG
jgi:hypothetical protein